MAVTPVMIFATIPIFIKRDRYPAITARTTIPMMLTIDKDALCLLGDANSLSNDMTATDP